MEYLQLEQVTGTVHVWQEVPRDDTGSALSHSVAISMRDQFVQ